MKSKDFFSKRANDYILEIEKVVEEYLKYAKLEKKQYQLLQDSTSELKLKIKLFFSEYKYGKIFLKHIKSIEEKSTQPTLSSNQILKSYKMLLELLIYHIEEFRK